MLVCEDCVNELERCIDERDAVVQQNVSPDSSVSRSNFSSNQSQPTVITQSVGNEVSNSEREVYPGSQPLNIEVALRDPNVKSRVEEILKQPMPFAIRKRKLADLNVDISQNENLNQGQVTTVNNNSDDIDLEALMNEHDERIMRKAEKRRHRHRSNSQRSRQSNSSKSSIASIEAIQSFEESVPLRTASEPIISRVEVRVMTPDNSVHQRSPPIVEAPTANPSSTRQPPQPRQIVVDLPEIDDDDDEDDDLMPPPPPRPRPQKRNSKEPNDRQVPQINQGTRRAQIDTDDGNAHSNSAAPRRVHFNVPKAPVTARPNPKDISGG